MRDMIEGFDSQAKDSGARIVLSCGFDWTRAQNERHVFWRHGGEL